MIELIILVLILVGLGKLCVNEDEVPLWGFTLMAILFGAVGMLFVPIPFVRLLVVAALIFGGMRLWQYIANRG